MNLKRLIAMSEMCCHTESERHELLAAVPVLCRRLMAAEAVVEAAAEWQRCDHYDYKLGLEGSLLLALARYAREVTDD